MRRPLDILHLGIVQLKKSIYLCRNINEEGFD